MEPTTEPSLESTYIRPQNRSVQRGSRPEVRVRKSVGRSPILQFTPIDKAILVLASILTLAVIVSTIYRS